ncbi:MAG: hypothetical protein A2046_06050 [Bacteroidetes bacterium GWA2_30_7]|nr:MAG: hypothetical protein A2046_06050 [Bacteroidetes bacterium GWA2_30_7]
MKTTATLILLAISGLLFSQKVPESNGSIVSTFNKDENYITSLTSFELNLFENQLYFKWTVKAETKDCLYIMEKSVDNQAFSRIGIIKGIGVPNENIDILYCFKDSNINQNTSYYRIKQLYESGIIRYSDTKVFENPSIQYVVDNINK